MISTRAGVYSLSGEEIIRHVRNRGRAKDTSSSRHYSSRPKRLYEMEDVKALMSLARITEEATFPAFPEKP